MFNCIYSAFNVDSPFGIQDYKIMYDDLKAENMYLRKALYEEVIKPEVFGIPKDIRRVIEDEKKKEYVVKWRYGIYKGIDGMKANTVGVTGERIVQLLCDRVGIAATIDGTKTRRRCGGCGDGTINGYTVEIKTARKGVSGTYQHELGEHPWKADKLIFIDIDRDQCWLSIMSNFTKAYYLVHKRKATPYFNKMITRRKESCPETSGAYRLTLTDSDLMGNSMNTVRINQSMSDSELRTFIEHHFEKNDS